MKDRQLLQEILEHESLTEREREAFTDMLEFLVDGGVGLNQKQREWAKRVHERLVPAYANDWSAGRVPRGKEVPTPEVLKRLPMRPPGR
jgi:hypothetical protein